MAAGHTTWNEAELQAFLEAYMEEIEARTITSTCPNRQGYANLEVKMYQKAQKVGAGWSRWQLALGAAHSRETSLQALSGGQGWTRYVFISFLFLSSI